MASVYEIVTNKIIDGLEKGVIPWESPYLFKGYQNVSGRPYSGVNTLLLSLETALMGYTMPVWATFTQIKNNGWKLKKGSQAAVVTFYRRVEKKVKIDDSNNSVTEKVVDTEKNDSSNTYYVLRYYNVFNIDRIEGVDMDKMKDIKSATNYVSNQTLMDYINNEGIAFKVNQPTEYSYYAPAKDEIVMSYIKTQDKYNQVLAHEITHSTGHPNRLNRFNLDFTEKEVGFEELVAEIGSAFLLSALNFPMNIENSSAYIESWLKYFKDKSNKKTTIFKASSQAQKACEYVLKAAEEKIEVA